MLGWERADVIARATEEVSPSAAALFAAAIEQRARRRPLQHLTGHQAFWKHDFLVTRDVLIPRPETELLVETALELIRHRPAPLVVDVGTGSGCLALSLAAERPDAEVHAVDVSDAALRVAQGNALRLNLGERVTFHHGDLLAPVRHLAGGVDLVISNPPYVTVEELAGLEPEVRDHDPRVALVPPEGVIALYARLLGQARAILRPGGVTAVEVGLGQAAGVVELARGHGLEVVDVRHDLGRNPRAVIVRRPAVS